MSTHQHTITALVQNETGTLNRLTSMFRRRGFSIASLNAGDCEEEGYSRLTLVVNGDDVHLNHCVRQLDRVIGVVEVSDLQPAESVRRELALIKVKGDASGCALAAQMGRDAGAQVVVEEKGQIVVEMSDSPLAIDQLMVRLSGCGQLETVRTGLIAMRLG